MKNIVEKIKKLEETNKGCKYFSDELKEILDAYAPQLTGQPLNELWFLIDALVNLGYIKGINAERYRQRKSREKQKDPVKLIEMAE